MEIQLSLLVKEVDVQQTPLIFYLIMGGQDRKQIAN
jgi:hypothetical protein